MTHPDAGPAVPPARGAIALLERAVGLITGFAMALSAAGLLVALLLVIYAVVMRYLFNRAPTWVDDSVGFLLVGIVMLAAACTLRRGGHISVDILTGRLGGNAKRWAEAWSMGAVLVVSAILVVNGWQTAMSSRMLGITTSGNVEIPVYWLQLLLPLGGAILGLVALEALLRNALGAPSLATPPAPGAGEP
jgi:TRAP-type C4-dicarboxylate transport system permease small subunit